MNKQQKKFYIILSILLALVFTTKAFASLTFTNNAITGTTASTIDLGSGHDLYLQTNGGNVGIGTSAPMTVLHIKGLNPVFTLNDNRDQSYSIGDQIGAVNFASDDTSVGHVMGDVRAQIAAVQLDTFGASQGLSFATTRIGNGILSQQMLLTESGDVLLTRNGLTHPLGESASSGQQYITITGNGGGGTGNLQLSNTSGSTDGQGLGSIEWHNISVGTGNANSRSAYITAALSGTNGVDIGSYLAFATEANGVGSSSAGTERMRITNTGFVGFGTTSPTAKIDIKDGHYASTQTTLPTTSVTGTGYSGSSIVAGSTDTTGAITATVGANAGTLVVTFNTAYGIAPFCTVTPATATAQVDHNKMYVTSSTSAMTINFVASPTGGSETWNYICLQ